jgi:hypothetical protein
MMPLTADNPIRNASTPRASAGTAGRRTWFGVGLLGSVLITGGAFFWAFQHSGADATTLARFVPSGLREPARDLYSLLRRPGAPPQSSAAVSTVERAAAPLAIYDSGLAAGWTDWSWAKRDLNAGSPAYQGRPSLTMTPKAYEGVYLHHDPFALAGYGALEFVVHGEVGMGSDGMTVRLAETDKKMTEPIALDNYVARATDAGDGWHAVSIPLVTFGLKPEGASIVGIVFQGSGRTEAPSVALNVIRLTPDLALPPATIDATVAVTVDAGADRHAISPLIYGVAVAGGDRLAALGAGMNRWGGNPNTRYNWVVNGWNHGRDWKFSNYGTPGLPPGKAADDFVRASRDSGVATLFTIPTIGWVAKDTNDASRSVGVPATGGPALSNVSGAIAGYDPTANRRRTSVPSRARKRAPFVPEPKPAANGGYTVYQDEFVNHLVTKFGRADQGGCRFYAMDNEADLWAGTHTDVHPARMGYDDMLANFMEYATAVKAVDPSAQITGPVSWGWTGYLYSAKDQGSDNFATHADRRAHGGEPFLLWFLKQARAHDTKVGRRTLDVLDVHHYPQGAAVYSPKADAATRALRLRSTRALYDPTYQDESWIGQPIQLIPRLKEWIAQGYPGTKVGITEWNFGAEEDISGGLATADALGIFGREGVDLACYWVSPKPGSPTGLAFRLFRRPTSAGAGFGDLSCRARSADPDRLTTYAAIDRKTGDLTVVLINKMPKATVTVPLTVQNYQAAAVARQFRFAAGDTEITKLDGPAVSATGRVTLSIPPYSATLIRIPGRAAGTTREVTQR